MKTWKKIDETRRRAGEVMKLKQKNSEKQNEKAKHEDERRQKEHEHKQRIADMRAERNNEKSKI